MNAPWVGNAWLRLACGVAALWILSTPAAASDERLSFNRLSIDDGLSQSIVERMVQDRTGFMWFATEDGLNRYDGYAFRQFRSEAGNPASLSHNEIKAISVDQNGMLWVGTFASGLNRLDPVTETVTRFAHDPSDPGSLGANTIRCVLEDRAGAMWIGTQGGGLDLYDSTSGRFVHHRFDPASVSSLSHDDVRVLFEDSSGFLWVGTNGGGLDRYDRASNRFSHFRHDPLRPNSLAHDVVLDIVEDRRGVLWVATYGGGLDAFDPRLGSFKHHRADPGNPRALPSDLVRCLCVDHDGNLWVGTDGGGLSRLHGPAGGFTTWSHDPMDSRSLSADRVFSLAEDRSRVLWIGTYGGGLSSIDLSRKRFGHLRHQPDDDSLSHDIVWGIHQDPLGVVWIGTDSGGLDRYDPRRRSWRHYVHGGRAVRSITRDATGRIWLATAGDGLAVLDLDRDRFIHYRNDPGDPSSLANDDLRSVVASTNGQLWVATFGGGLDLFDPTTGSCRHFRHRADDPYSLSNDFVRTVLEESDHRVWVATHGGGLNLLDPETGKAIRYRNDPDDPSSLSNDYVFALVEADDGRLWVGTYGGGLNLLDPATGECLHFSQRDGLASDAVSAVLSDTSGRLWISTNRGLSRFDPRTRSFRTYDIQDGLQSNEFNGGAAFRSSSGELFFGGINGLNHFDPDEITSNPRAPDMVITDIQLFNRSVAVGEEIDGRVILPRSITSTDRVSLSYRENLFSIEFAALHFGAPRKNRYVYTLQGFSASWIPVNANRRHATFTGLPPGKYLFQVRGSNSDGLWSDTPAKLEIVITPPFWGTWWFRLTLALTAAAIVALALRTRMRSVSMRAELEAAHDAQMAIMPHGEPQFAGFNISGVCVPAHEVGGDFFDYFWLEGEPRRLCVAVGDVAGKAMRAAMTAVMSDGMLISRASQGGTVAEIMTSLNHSILQKVGDRMFTAMCLVAIDGSRRELTYCNAGLCEPLLKHDQTVCSLAPVGPRVPLGAFTNVQYESRRVPLAPGDVVVIFSDGVVEARSSSGAMYGFDAPQSFLARIDTSRLDAQEIRELMLADVRRHAASAKQSDDLVLVVIRCLEPTPRGEAEPA